MVHWGITGSNGMKLKIGKVPGVANVPVEMLKAIGDHGIDLTWKFAAVYC